MRRLGIGFLGRRSGRLVTSTLVARELVELAKADNPPRELTILKLIALTYIAHGRSFAELGEGLIDEQVLAWPYGPAFRNLYGEIRAFGVYPVMNVPKSHLERGHPDTKLTKDEVTVVKSVYDDFKDESEEDLIRQNQKPGTPWYYIWDGLDINNQKIIEDKMTRRYFSESGGVQNVATS